MKIETKVIIEIKGQVIELTKEEATSLYYELNSLINTKEYIPYPTYPSYPTYPLITYGPVTTSKPMYTPDIQVYCERN